MVRRTAQEMGYYPNAAAQTLKTKRRDRKSVV